MKYNERHEIIDRSIVRTRSYKWRRDKSNYDVHCAAWINRSTGPTNSKIKLLDVPRERKSRRFDYKRFFPFCSIEYRPLQITFIYRFSTNGCNSMIRSLPSMRPGSVSRKRKFLLPSSLSKHDKRERRSSRCTVQTTM